MGILQMYFKFLCSKVAAGCMSNNMVNSEIYFMHSHIYRNVYFIINHFPLQLQLSQIVSFIPFSHFAAAFYIKHARNEGSLLDKYSIAYSRHKLWEHAAINFMSNDQLCSHTLIFPLSFFSVFGQYANLMLIAN